MTDRESELIARLMDGDMEAYDELMPNARPEDRKNFEDVLKKAKEIGGEQDPIGRAWLIFVLHLISRNMDNFREYDRKANQELSDAWDRCIANIVNNQKDEQYQDLAIHESKIAPPTLCIKAPSINQKDKDNGL